MRVAYGVLWVALSMAACTRPNPLVCCESASDCSSIGVKDQVRTCAAGLVCSDHTCTEPQCTTNADCSGATPACDTSTNTCVVCVDNSQCSGSTPTCDTTTHTCTGSGGMADAGVDGSIDATPDAGADAAVCGGSSSCVEAPAAGWNGPAIFYEGATGTPPPACAGDYAMTAADLDSGLNGGSASCSCSCGAPTGTTCGNATLETHSSAGCLTTATASQTVSSSTCSNYTLGAATAYFRLLVPNVTGGSCAPSLAKNIPTPSWSTQFRACTSSATLTSAGCNADQVCAPRPSAPFDSQVCIYASGDVACPTGSSYSNRLVRYASFTDTRNCSSCTCGAPSGSCGGGAAVTEGSGTCGSMVDAQILAGQCKQLSVGVTAKYVAYTPGSGATCTASTGTVTGSLTATQPTTFCCLTP